MDHLIKPYGGKLNNSLCDSAQAENLKTESEAYPAITLAQRQQCDLEMIMNGALSPLDGFMSQNDYNSVVNKTCLGNGLLWPMPYYLDVKEDFASKLSTGSLIALRDIEGFMPAVLEVNSIWQPDKNVEAEAIYGTTDNRHPGVHYLFNQVNDIYIGGRIFGVQAPYHYDFDTLRDTPEELRQYFEKLGWRNIIAFHTSKPMHQVHFEITMRAAKKANTNILLHPVVGMAKPGDIQYHARVHCYQAIKKYYPKNMIALSLLPMAIRMAGPREALMNAIIRQNYGCTHYIVGTEHAAPPNVRDDAPRFYEKGESQEYTASQQSEIDIVIIQAEELCYSSAANTYVPVDSHVHDTDVLQTFSNRRVLDAIALNHSIPPWATYPEVVDELHKVCPPRAEQGITLFFTGLSGSGKSTLARILYAQFVEAGKRPTTLLDGDVVRLNLSSGLGFSKKDRDINVRRIGFVASLITKNRGVAICAPIAPYESTRKHVRDTIELYGAFVEIHVATPLEECERRDRKGLYARARKGIIPEFTGISDPYEAPKNPEIRVDTTDLTPMQAAQEIYLYLVGEGYIDQSTSRAAD